MDRFTGWYNEEHQHSGIGYVTPLQRHTGEDKVLLTRKPYSRHYARQHPDAPAL
ncbi:hypothetical protein PCO82_14685 [Pectobacteriaceae bacterium CE90]|nr:hypothetical protein [Prodigiosinella sp. LS101]WJV55311.1 hypothetical protein PCO85_07895 [Prodigiosinella sp. LS101]WJV59674.1 hypothetical protein PCO84_07900 [Pectobacteriaceae bacterium C111]WJY13794.1 hypothetical protein PCO82_14685 [Pectobacteriaceae bacterium CE90]